MAEIKFVRPLDQVKGDVVRDLKTNWKSIRDLSRRHGLSAEIVAELRRQHDPQGKCKNVIKAARAARRPVIVVSEPAASSSRTIQAVNAWFIWLTALVLGAVGLFFNVQYWYAYGVRAFGVFGDAVNYGGIAFGILGGGIDCVTVLLPANLSWCWRHVPLFAVWSLCAVLSWMAAVGFSASNFGDSLQARGTVVEHRKALNDELASVRAERAKITEDRDPQVLEERIQIERGKVGKPVLERSNNCKDITLPASAAACAAVSELRGAKRMAELRIELDDRLHRLTEEVANLPSISAMDPGAATISRLSFGRVEAGLIENIRVFGFALVPSLAGFLLAFARTLEK